MKAYRVNLKGYEVELPEPVTDDKGKVHTNMPFDVRSSLASLLFVKEMELSVEQAFEVKEIADKIRAADGTILLDQKEFDWLKSAYETIRSPNEHELEFYNRIRNPQEVEVEEKKEGEVGDNGK